MRQVIFDNKQDLAKRSGFTIIELLIVIVVIGILTTLTVVAYGGIQARTRDTIVKNAAKQLGVELQRFAADTGKTPMQTGGGSNGGGSGWFSSQISGGSYPLPTETVLVNGGYLPSGFTAALPKNIVYGNSNSTTLMLYGCGSKYVIYYSLEAPTSGDISDFSAVKTQCSGAASYQTSYNMQGGYIFN